MARAGRLYQKKDLVSKAAPNDTPNPILNSLGPVANVPHFGDMADSLDYMSSDLARHAGKLRALGTMQVNFPQLAKSLSSAKDDGGLDD